MQLSEKAIGQMISPKDMISSEVESVIIKSFNKFIKDNWNSIENESKVYGNEIASHVAINLNTSVKNVIESGYLQFAAQYTRKGWDVKIISDYPPIFVFSPKAPCHPLSS